MFTRPRKPFRKTCSEECHREAIARNQRGKKQSAETIAKRAISMKEVWADPERNAGLVAAGATNMKRWLSDPENAKIFAQRSSERMRLRHTDPEFQRRRDERSSRLMKENWEKYREEFTTAAIERYLMMEETGTGLCSPDAQRKRNERAKWIMTKAQEALRLETDYNAVFEDVQARMRREMPYDGPQEGSEYMDYLQQLGRAVAGSRECRSIADPFLSDALKRLSREWDQMKVPA